MYLSVMRSSPADFTNAAALAQPVPSKILVTSANYKADLIWERK
jgi:hypothetical protein